MIVRTTEPGTKLSPLVLKQLKGADEWISEYHVRRGEHDENKRRWSPYHQLILADGSIVEFWDSSDAARWLWAHKRDQQGISQETML